MSEATCREIRRINFYAGPGSGKSTFAARMFGELKVRNHDVEHIPEYIKTWAYTGKRPESYDQLYVFSKQLHAEDAALRHVKMIVTDSPILMNAAYSAYYGFRPAEHLIGIASEFERDFPSLNFFIDRTVPYIGKGRYQTLQQAVEFDEWLLNFLDKYLDHRFHRVTVEDFSNIVALIERSLHASKDTQRGSYLGSNACGNQTNYRAAPPATERFFGLSHVFAGIGTALSRCCAVFRRPSK